ncbi:ubiquinol-cytochrome c related protein, putative [Babesia ovis]|uniref:Ubiquinol-cytochrome c related protein, putative n=1 Tax=Babesia ovis TaxID=5869 RepID=A0A9W5TB42_BABOV|nr:ubiquinol-cytochrome c related protein, putative [Babesia ovis]
MNPMKKVQPFGVLALCRGQCPRHLKSFGFEANDETAQLLLGIVHIWLLHHRMHRERMDTEKLLLWEYLWVHMRHILCAQEIHELQFRGNLEEMQHKTLGFCLALDESVGDYQQTGDPKLLKKMLLIYFYEKDETMMQSPQLDLLTKYILSQVGVNRHFG